MIVDPPPFTPNPNGIVQPGMAGYRPPGAISNGLDWPTLMAILRGLKRPGTKPAVVLPFSDEINDPRTGQHPGATGPDYPQTMIDESPAYASRPAGPSAWGPRQAPLGINRGFGVYRGANGLLTYKGTSKQGRRRFYS